MERIAAVHLDLRSRRWSQHRKAEAAGVTLAEYRAVMADPLLITTLEEAWRQLLLGAVAPALHGMIETATLVGREGMSDRQAIFRMVGLMKQPGQRETVPPPAALRPSGIAERLEAAKAGQRSLPAPGMASSVPEAIDADYVMEPAETDSGDTAEFV